MRLKDDHSENRKFNSSIFNSNLAILACSLSFATTIQRLASEKKINFKSPKHCHRLRAKAKINTKSVNNNMMIGVDTVIVQFNGP